MLKYAGFILLVGFCFGAPTLPEFEDPLFIADFALDLGGVNGTEGLATGEISLCNGTITGLSGLQDRFVITPAPGPGQPLRQRLVVNITLAEAAIMGLYTAEVELYESLLPESGHATLTGLGSIAGRLENGWVNVDAFVVPFGKSADTKAAVTNLHIDLGFEAAEVNLQNFAVNGTLLDWDEFNSNVKEIFDQIWGEVKDPLSEIINDVINYAIEDCTLADLVGIIGGGPTDCIKIPEGPEFGIRNDTVPCQSSGPGFVCPEASGNFPDPINCAGYYSCQDFVVTGHSICPDDLLFNPVIGNCDFPWNVDCNTDALDLSK